MKIAKTILLVVVVVIVAILAYAATRPGTLHVERSENVKASPDKIFPMINDFHNWGAWSPYEHRDPAMKKTISGAPSGKGAVYEWIGNSDVGQGRMEITSASPSSNVTIQLDFLKPIEGHDVAIFTLEPQGETTRVTWAMDGPTPYIGKVMGIFVNMDNMVGSDFAAGLSNLKTLAEQ